MFELAMSKNFKMQDLGPLRYFLGLVIACSKAGIFLSQRKYDLELLSDSRQLACKPISIPMEPNAKLSPQDGDLHDDPTAY